MTDLSAVRGIELFAGPGGMSEGAVLAGMDPDNMVGVEFDEMACATAEAAGHRRVLADVTSLDPLAFAIKHFGLMWAFLVLWFHASPPCQGFSLAGKGKGREDSEMILAAIAAIRDGHLSVEEGIEYVRDNAKDGRSALTLEAMRWIDELLPETITLEQVPAVLPLWEAIAEWLRTLGYNVVTGKVTAEQYGVPQTRKRAILLASRSVQVALPEPTHSKYNSRNPEKLEEGMPRWVSMAEALGWGMTRRPYPTIAPGQTATGGGPDPMMVGGSGSRRIFAKEREVGHWYMGDVYNANGCIRPIDTPAPTITASMDNGNFQFTTDENPRIQSRIERYQDRPALTVIDGEGRSGTSITVEEAGILQSFPASYPWHGNRTKRSEQVGNAVPPLLGMHMIRAAFGLTVQVEPDSSGSDKAGATASSPVAPSMADAA